MKIAVVGPARSVHVERWISFLDQRGHEVVVLTDARPRRALGRARVELMPARIPSKAARVLVSRVHLARLIDRERPEVVHIQSLGAMALLAPAVPADRLVVSPWGSDVADAAGLRRAIVRTAVRRASLVFCTSRAMADEIRQSLGVSADRIEVISWGVDPATFRPASREEVIRTRRSLGIPDGAITVTGIRTVAATYRTAELVRAFAGANATGQHLVLVSGFVPGDRRAARQQRRYRTEVFGMARRIRPDSVTVIDRPLSEPEYAALLQASDVAVTIPGTDQRASSVLEALAVGSTVVGSDIAPYREMREAGYRLALLPEPIESSLRDWLAHPTLLDPAARASNAATIASSETRDAGYRAMEAHLVRLAGR